MTTSLFIFSLQIKKISADVIDSVRARKHNEICRERRRSFKNLFPNPALKLSTKQRKLTVSAVKLSNIIRYVFSYYSLTSLFVNFTIYFLVILSTTSVFISLFIQEQFDSFSHLDITLFPRVYIDYLKVQTLLFG